MTTLHIIPNAHLDPVWLWDQREGLDQGIRTIRSVLDLMDEFPELTFVRGEAAIYRHLEGTAPAAFARVSCLTPSWGQTGFNKAAGISGASEDPAIAAKCTAPEELGELVKTILETPDHLAIPDVVLQPMVQDICPM